MKYYEFDYKSKLQQVLWNTNIFAVRIVYFLIGFAFTVAFNNFFSTFVSTFLLIAFCIVGLVIIIYNSCKMKGVFLFDDYIEVSSIYTKKTIIPIREITDIKKIEKYGLVTKGDVAFKGGDRFDVVQIHFKNAGIAAFKIKNQDDFLEELKKRINENKE